MREINMKRSLSLKLQIVDICHLLHVFDFNGTRIHLFINAVQITSFNEATADQCEGGWEPEDEFCILFL